MTSPQKSGRRDPLATSQLLQTLLKIALGLTMAAVGVHVALRLGRPALEPMPTVDTADQEIRDLIASAVVIVLEDERSAAAWGDLGAVYYVHGFEIDSQVCFRNAERLDPLDYRWPYLLAVSLGYSDPEQLAAYRRAAQRCGPRSNVQLRLAENLLDRGELGEAATQIESVLSYAPSEPRALFAKARLLLAQGKLDEAKSHVKRSIETASDKQAPFMRAPFTLLAQLCRRTGDARGEALAVDALKQIPEGAPSWEDPDLNAVFSLDRSRSHRLVVADRLARTGNSALATRLLYALSVESNGASAAEKLAQALNQEGRFAEAESMLRRQLQDCPDDERLHYLLGVSCFEQQRHAEAAAAFQRVIELKPDQGYAWHNRGLALIMIGNKEAARDAFAAAVRLNPMEASSRLNLAELLLEEGNRDEARKCLEVAIKLEPESTRARELLSRAEGK